MKLKTLILAILLIPLTAEAGTLHRERVYPEAWCKKAKGKIEYVLSDRSRVDCLTKNYAVEVKFARNFKDSVGQALYYARKSGRKPGIVLIIEKDSDWSYYAELRALTEPQIKLWVITPRDLKGIIIEPKKQPQPIKLRLY